METLKSGVLNRGVIDGPEDTAGPDGSCLEAIGFGFRHGYAKAELGRTKLTSSEIWTGCNIRQISRWVQPDGTERFYAFLYGALYEATSNAFSSKTLRSYVDLGGHTGTYNPSLKTVTFGATAKMLLTVQVGDQFFFDADGISLAGNVKSVDSDTQITLTSYPGSAEAGDCTIWRKMADAGFMLIAGNRIWIFDGTNTPHWYGDRGDGTWEFRPAGLPVPANYATLAFAAGGQLSAGDYAWAWAYRDRAGRTGNPRYSHYATASADQKCTLANFINGPEWATEIDIWRTKVGETEFFCVYKDIEADLATSVKDNGTTTLTLATGSQALVADMHIDRYVEFAGTGNKYLITDNDTTTITVSGDASSATGGESGTDHISITGGFDLDQLVAGSYVDMIPDGDLDTTYPAPDENDQPPAGLTCPIVLDGGGRLAAYEDGTQTKIWVSGRNSYANVPEGAARGGLGEFDFWHTSFHAGNTDGDEIVQLLALGTRAFALKQESVWEIYKEPLDVGNWEANPSRLAQSIGCISPYSVAKKQGVAYWLGVDGEETDIIRFDGNVGYGMMRQVDPSLGTSRMRVIVDNIADDNVRAAGCVFMGAYWLSYIDSRLTPFTNGNNRTLRYDLKTHRLDIQPYGVGVFAPSYRSSGPVLMGSDPAPMVVDYPEYAYVYQMLGGAADNGGSVSRIIIPKAFSFGIGTLTTWVSVRVNILNTAAYAGTAPCLYFSVDGKPFNDSSKTWTLLTGDEDWPTAVGKWTAFFELPVGVVEAQSQILHLKLTSADQDAWGIIEFEVDGDPVKKDANMEV